MINSPEIPPIPTLTEGMTQKWDATFAAAYAEAGLEYGLYTYSVTYLDRPYGSEGHAVAVVMNAKEAELLIAEGNRAGYEDLEEAKRHLSPADKASDAYAQYVPTNNLPWDAFMEHSCTSIGRTAQEALIKAREAHLQRELELKAMQTRPHDPHAVLRVARAILTGSL